MAELPSDGGKYHTKDSEHTDSEQSSRGNDEDADADADADGELTDLPETHDNCPCREEEKEKDKWASWRWRLEYVLSVVGHAFGVGAIWRFPVICAKNGGGSFLYPFLFFFITCGVPLYYMESCLGQFSCRNAIMVFDICPLFKGVGILMAILSFYFTWYTVVVLMWTFYYIVNSFFALVPWTTCDGWWNTLFCKVNKDSMSAAELISLLPKNTTDTSLTPAMTTEAGIGHNALSSPVIQFWKYNVLRRSSGLDQFGGGHIHLIICLFLAWACIIVCNIRGTYYRLEKVAFVLNSFPFVFLLILLIGALTQDGASEGLWYYLVPDKKILQYQVWVDAAVQVFYTLGTTFGGVLSFAIHNSFHNNLSRDTGYYCGISLFVSLCSGLIAFAGIGSLARDSGSTITELSKISGPGFLFVAYSFVLGQIPGTQFWSILCFLIFAFFLFCSILQMSQHVSSCIINLFHNIIGRKRALAHIVTGIIMALLGIPFTCGGGVYLLQLMDWYSCSFGLLFGAALEAIMIGWMYGADRFSKDISIMTGKEVFSLIRILWVIVIPILMLVSFLLLLAGSGAPECGDSCAYKTSAVAIGYVIGLIPVLAVIIRAIVQIFKTVKNVSEHLKPPENWGPCDWMHAYHGSIYQSKPYQYQATTWKRFVTNISGLKDSKEPTEVQKSLQENESQI